MLKLLIRVYGLVAVATTGLGSGASSDHLALGTADVVVEAGTGFARRDGVSGRRYEAGMLGRVDDVGSVLPNLPRDQDRESWTLRVGDART